jgi:hypothetical protein
MAVDDSQGARVFWNGIELGTYVSISPSWSVASPYECTNASSLIVGAGAGARVLKQYNASAIEPGEAVVEFIGSVSLTIDEMGAPGILAISWPGFSYVANAFLGRLNGVAARGELVHFSLTFQFTGFI